MTRKTLISTALALLVIAASAAEAGTLGRGLREGSVKQPDGRTERVTFEVTDSGGQVRIVMTEEGAGEVIFEEVRFEDDDLVFTWRTGEASIRCVLAPTGDDAYSGSCNDLRLVMDSPTS